MAEYDWNEDDAVQQVSNVDDSHSSENGGCGGDNDCYRGHSDYVGCDHGMTRWTMTLPSPRLSSN